MDFEGLGREVADGVRDPLTAEDRARRRAALIQSARGPSSAHVRKRLIWRGIWAGASLAAAVAVALIVFWPRSAAPPARPGLVCLDRESGASLPAGTSVAASVGARTIDFSDGSVAELNRGAAVELKRVTAGGVRLGLRRGRVRLRVRHARRQDWRVQAGPYQVRVVGTVFAVDWGTGGQELAVTVEAGTVEVSGGSIAQQPLLVQAGQRLVANPARHRLLAATAAREAEPPAEVGAEPAPAHDAQTTPNAQGSAAPPRRAQTKKPAPTDPAFKAWKGLAADGDYQRALAAAKRAGISRLMGRLSAEDLVELGDVARLARDAKLAERVWLAARKRAPRSKAAAAATFALGRLAEEVHRDPSAAIRWYRRLMRESPSYYLANDARGRAMVLLKQRGQLGDATQLARQYLERAPRGRYAELARQIVSAPGSQTR